MIAGIIVAAFGAQAPIFIDYSGLDGRAVIDMRYAGDENFVGAKVDGYKRAKCLLTPEAANALFAASRNLAEMGLSFRIFDCYRPQRAVDHFVRWSRNDDERTKSAYYPGTPKSELFPQGYIAERSGHSRGSTVDLTIDALDMGSRFDFFDPVSHTASDAIPTPARANRLLLRLIMEKNGFRNYDKEWWHYTLADEPYKDQYFDKPVK